MGRGSQRIAWIRQALRDAGLDVLVCTLPANVLMLSGYWPVVGSAVAVATVEGRVVVLAPEDEQSLARRGWADVRTFRPGSLDRLTSPVDTIRDPLSALFADLGVARGTIGSEDGDTYEPASYAAMYLYGAAVSALVHAAAPEAASIPGGAALTPLRTRLTVDEVAHVRLACAIAGDAFASAARGLRAGAREDSVAAACTAPLTELGLARDGIERAGGFAYCMSGPNAALAGAAYARTRAREIRAGDFVLVHCNSYVDGYWTDITRTYCVGSPGARQWAMYEAVFAARAAALAAIRPGAMAADVDRAARDVLTTRGFGDRFTHGVGHNVGFSAISMAFPPRLHPASPDRLDVGMTFNVEPAIYLEGFGGLRHCDVVTVTAEGAEVLTPFQSHPEELIGAGSGPS